MPVSRFNRCREYPGVFTLAMLLPVTLMARCCVSKALVAVLNTPNRWVMVNLLRRPGGRWAAPAGPENGMGHGRTAGEHDNKRARELCAGVRSGEIVLFDKGYVDFGHLRDLDERGVFWVTRAKDNMAYEVVQLAQVQG